MDTYDDDLSRFEADGAAPLPDTDDQGYVERDGARIWYATYGSGLPVILARCLSRHAKDYARLSATPDQFKPFAEAVGLMMKTQPVVDGAMIGRKV